MEVQITPPNLQTAAFRLRGTSPYVQNKFSAKAKEQIKAKQKAGSLANKGKRREPKDFKACYLAAMYVPSDGKWPNGAIPATAIKASMIDACRQVDFKMTHAKQCVFVECDGYDKDEMIPLIKITKGKPKYFEQALNCANGMPDIRARPMWDAGWEAVVRITYDADRFSLGDVVNLLSRAGSQVGIGEGRNASRHCAGLGWGAFELLS